MGFGERDDGARLERDDGDVHVVAHVGRVDEAGRRPLAVGVGHGDRRDVVLVGEDRLGHVDAVDAVVGFADPVEAHRRAAFVADAASRCAGGMKA